MQPVHYAPRTPARRAETVSELRSIDLSVPSAIIVVGEHALDATAFPPSVVRIDLPDPLFAARELYAVFHRLDSLQLERIVVLMPPREPRWTAVRDRLSKAARPLTE